MVSEEIFFLKCTKPLAKKSWFYALRRDHKSAECKHKQSCLTLIKDFTMWTSPAATEMRFGFEVTMYVMNK
jgi:pyrroloquinoline quinone biosynthesis protein A